MPELTKVTSKGQVVIPSGIRRALRLEEGCRLAVSSLGDLVLMRKVAIPDPGKEFEALTEFGKDFARKKGIRSEKDAVERIQRGRGVKSA